MPNPLLVNQQPRYIFFTAKNKSQTNNVCSVKKDTKRSSNTLLCLVFFFYGTDVSNETTGKETGKTRLCALCAVEIIFVSLFLEWFAERRRRNLRRVAQYAEAICYPHKKKMASF